MKSGWILGAAVATIAAACGGTVVFDEPGEGDGAGGSGAGNTSGGGNASTQSGPGNPTATTGSSNPTATTGSDVTVTVGTTGPGPGDGGAGPGPGPGPGPSGGGFGGDPSEGPGGVGGADNGSAGPSAVSTSSGCSFYTESTNQHCYLFEQCGRDLLELECQTNGDGPYSCWCYQDSEFVGTCTEPDVPFCSTDGCCESFWTFKG